MISLTSPTVSVNNVSETKKFLATLTGELAYASALAQTRTAKIVLNAEKDQMRKDIDRPTPWSLGALEKEDATKEGKPARIWFKDRFGYKTGLGAEDYLGVQILGGKRERERRSEKRLRLKGLLPNGLTWAPAIQTRLNQYGNVSGPLISKILANLGTIDTALNTGTRATSEYVVGTLGTKNTPLSLPGIFQVLRGGRQLKPVLWFIPKPTYSKRYRFYERGDAEFARHFRAEFGKAVDDALRTAK